MPHVSTSARPRAAVLVTLTTIFALVSSLFVGFPAQAADAAAGSLTWGTKSSFRGYVVGSGGSVIGGQGAADNGTATNYGAVDSTIDLDAGTGSASYYGTVNFTVASHGVDITLGYPVVRMTGSDTAVLDVTYDDATVALVEVDLTTATIADVDGITTVRGASTAITAAGVPIFQQYSEGTAMDDLTFSFASPIEDEVGTGDDATGDGDETGDDAGDGEDGNPAGGDDSAPGDGQDTGDGAGEGDDEAPVTDQQFGVTVAPATGLADGDSVTLHGTLPALTDGLNTSVYVLFCANGEDEIGTAAGRLSGADCDGSQQWLMHTSVYGQPTTGTVTDGIWTFSTTLNVTDAFGDKVCTTASQDGDECGIFVRLPHTFTASNSANPYVHDQLVPVTFAAPTPTVTVSKTQGLDADGETVTVHGENFLPSDPATSGTRPPLLGKFTGTYVAFGRYDDVWKPSEAAPRDSRRNGDNRWALLAEDVATIGGAAAGAITLNADGSFDATLSVTDDFAANTGSGNYGIYTYAAGGSTYAPFETFTPITFTAPTPTVTVSKTTGLDGDGETVTVTGTGFSPQAPATNSSARPPLSGLFGGTYVVFGKFADAWQPSTGAPATDRTVLDGQQQWALDPSFLNVGDPTNPIDPRFQATVAASGIPIDADGAFTATIKVSDLAPNANGNYGIYTYPGGGAVYAPYETYTPVSFASTPVTPGPDPEPETPVGDLTWGIYGPFTDYVEGPGAAGTVTTVGATRTGDVFGFTQSGGNANAPAGTGTATYAGSVTFTGHHGALNLALADPHVVLTSTTTATVSLLVDGTRATFATINLAAATKKVKDGATTYSGAKATLTSAGASAFQNFYPAGTRLDDLTFTIGASDTTVPTTPEKPTTPTTPDNGNTGSGGSTGGSTTTGGGTSTSTSTPSTTAVGSLTWGISSAFRNYVTGPIASGAISVSGASFNGLTFTFIQNGGEADPAKGTGTASYGGAVTFSGHHGDLNLRFSDPHIRLTGPDSAMLSLDVGGSRVDFATVDLGAASQTTKSGATRFTGAPVTLTAAGATAFQGYYSAGTRLDSLSVTFGAAAEATSSSGTRVVAASITRAPAAQAIPDTPPSSTGIELDDATLAALIAGEQVTISVPGFEPNEQGIMVVIYSTPTILAADLNADASGVVTWTGSLPASLTGEHTLTFQGSVDKGIVLDIPTSTVGMCLATDATLDWGFKEGFRAYVEGIAHGEWTLSGNVAEVTGGYQFTGGSGSLTEAATGTIGFEAGIEFTGHEGALDTTVSNPVIEFSSDGAYLLLDVNGETQQGEPINLQAVRFGTIDLDSATISADGNTVTIADAPVTLTADGASAFGTYPEGEALDALTLVATGADGCLATLAGVVVEEPAVEASPTEEPAAAEVTSVEVADEEGGSSTWLWIGAGALALIIAAGGIFLVRRGRE